MKKYIFYLIIIILLSACDAQRAFIVNPPNVNCFKYEKEKNLKFAINGLNLNVQQNSILNNKFGLASILYGGMSYDRSYYHQSKMSGFYLGAELGGIYYKYFTHHKYFEIQSGYGYCNNQIYRYRPDPFTAVGLHGTYYECNSNTDYHKLYLQPAFFFIGNKMSIGFASKLNLVYFNKYDYSFTNQLDDGNDGYTSRAGIKGQSSFSNKFCFVYEPVINIKFGKIFYIQFVGALANNVYTGTSYDYIDGHNPYFNPTFHTFHNPQYSYVKMNIGFEFKLGKGKKSLIADRKESL